MNSYIAALLVYICASIAFMAKADAIGIGESIIAGTYIINAGMTCRK